MSYTGWVLSDSSREELLQFILPTHPRVIAHHVTQQVGEDATIPAPAKIRVVGTADHDGVQVLVVTVDGASRAPDGRLYHCTWSLEEGKFPKESNLVLAYGWKATVVSLDVDAEPFMHV